MERVAIETEEGGGGSDGTGGHRNRRDGRGGVMERVAIETEEGGGAE